MYAGKLRRDSVPAPIRCSTSRICPTRSGLLALGAATWTRGRQARQQPGAAGGPAAVAERRCRKGCPFNAALHPISDRRVPADAWTTGRLDLEPTPRGGAVRCPIEHAEREHIRVRGDSAEAMSRTSGGAVTDIFPPAGHAVAGRRRLRRSTALPVGRGGGSAAALPADERGILVFPRQHRHRSSAVDGVSFSLRPRATRWGWWGSRGAARPRPSGRDHWRCSAPQSAVRITI